MDLHPEHQLCWLQSDVPYPCQNLSTPVDMATLGDPECHHGLNCLAPDELRPRLALHLDLAYKPCLSPELLSFPLRPVPGSDTFPCCRLLTPSFRCRLDSHVTGWDGLPCP